MSSIGGVGMIGGLGTLGPSLGIGGTSAISTGGLNGPLGDANAAMLTALSGTQVDQLMKLLAGFSSAEILIALMLSGASVHHKKHDDGCDAGMGFLLGLAMASQLGQQMPSQLSGIPGPAAASTGGMINLTA